jgi:hypothetical protein
VVEVDAGPDFKHQDLYVKTDTASGLSLGSGIGLSDDLEFRVVSGEVKGSTEAETSEEEEDPDDDEFDDFDDEDEDDDDEFDDFDDEDDEDDEFDDFDDEDDDEDDEDMDEELQSRLKDVLDGKITQDEFTGKGEDED